MLNGQFVDEKYFGSKWSFNMLKKNFPVWQNADLTHEIRMWISRDEKVRMFGISF